MPTSMFDTQPHQNFDYVVMSGTYNLTPTNNLKLFEDISDKTLSLTGTR